MYNKIPPVASIPSNARMPINHCNLPASILGSVTFQQHPTPLTIDGVQPLHKTLFNELAQLGAHEERVTLFTNYMKAHFMLDDLNEAGFTDDSRIDRRRAHYLSLLRGWFFNPDSREGAVLKGWVESRFGLLPRFHHGKITQPEESHYQHYLSERCAGLYNTNALEAQIDLLYSYCQYELAHNNSEKKHITLYRGTNDFSNHDVLQQLDKHTVRVLLNNINSFSLDKDTASQFGDTVMCAQVPIAKILFYGDLLPVIGMSEKEFAVIGGVYQVTLLDS